MATNAKPTNTTPSIPGLPPEFASMSPGEQLAAMAKLLAAAQAEAEAAKARAAMAPKAKDPAVRESSNAATNGYTSIVLPGCPILGVSAPMLRALVTHWDRIGALLKTYATPERLARLDAAHTAHKLAKANAS